MSEIMKEKLDTIKSKRFFNVSNIEIIYIFVIATFCGLMSYLTPYQCDDLWFKLRYETFPNLWDYVSYSYTTTNGRLADLSTYFMVSICPPWLFSVLCGLMVAVSCRYMLKLISLGGNNNVVIQIISLSIYILFLPWGELMFTRACSLNYIFTSGLVMPCIYYFVKERENISGIKLLLFLILSLIAASMHEGFATPVLCGFLVYAISYRSLDRLQKCMLITMIIGVCITISSPGIWNRINIMSGSETVFIDMLKGKLLALAYTLVRKQYCMVILWIISGVLLYKSKGKINIEQRKYILFLSTIIVASVLISGYSGNGQRSYWLSNMMTIVLFGYLFSNIAENVKSNLFVRIVAYGSILFVLTHMAFSVVWEYKLNDEFKIVSKLYEDSEDGIVYYDTYLSADLPFICLNKPVAEQFYREWNIAPYNAYYGGEGKSLVVLPSEFKDYTLSASDCVSKELGIYKTQENHLIKVVSENTVLEPLLKLIAVSKNGRKDLFSLDLIKYKTENNRDYYYLAPYNIDKTKMSSIDKIEENINGYIYNWEVRLEEL